MPRTASKATVNNFVGGLISDYHELNNPPNTTVAEDNCDLDRKGSRKRRLGIDFEPDAVPSSVSYNNDLWSSMYTKAYEWVGVNEDGNTNFLVVQGGNRLTFYDLNFDTLSEGVLPFSVNLDDHKAPSAYDTTTTPVEVASGKGALFVVGAAIDPFYIQYDPVTNDITTTDITIRIRDFQVQDPSVSYTTQLTTLTAAQKYDLYNQGWGAKASCDAEDTGHQDNQLVLDWYKNHSHLKLYPSKNKSWWLGKVVNEPEGVNTFEPTPWDVLYVGDMQAPTGTYILDAFAQDRSAASGIPGLPVVLDSARPTAVAFTAGRVFYGHKNKIFFSQVIVDDFSVVGNCYQSADPTSEQISDLIDTDGGVQQIIDASSIHKLFAYQNSLFIYCTVGVWALGGSAIGSGFKATDYSIYKVSNAGTLSARAFIDVEGVPMWWSKLGIYALSSDAAKQGYSVQNILEKKLQLYYNAIPPLSKLRATGAYDRTKKVITWMFNSTGTQIGGNDYVCDRLLNFDTILGAFYPYTVQIPEGATGPFITDCFNVLDVVVALAEETVIDESGFPVVDELNATVTILSPSPGNAGNTSSSLKFLTFYKAVA